MEHSRVGPQGPSAKRSFNGCWTCRLRRKKCDENPDKPEWMDGGLRQTKMAQQIKREVKDNAHLRSAQRSTHLPGGYSSFADSALESVEDNAELLNGMQLHDTGSTDSPLRNLDCTAAHANTPSTATFERSDTVLLMFYLDYLFPFLFPFYRPSPLQGGRAWILEMMISRPVVRQATLCQSSYFLSRAHEAANQSVDWDTVLTRTRDAFEVLRQSLQLMSGSDISEHLHGAVRVMASIMQVQRFEIALLSFENCRAHLTAALSLFKQLLDTESINGIDAVRSNFEAFMNKLGPSTWVLPAQCIQVPSAEQSAFRFSSSLLLLDDIIASTALQEEPALYAFHQSLLTSNDGLEPLIQLDTAIGCQNWVFLEIGKVAALDAWKTQCKKNGNLDVIELVHRATVIKECLMSHLRELERNSRNMQGGGNDLMDIFTVDCHHPFKPPPSQTSLITRVWAHAALVYLFTVVSGWQPASDDIRYHVCSSIELLTYHMPSPTLLRTMVWPFCVTGCLAEPAQESQLRGIVECLRPPSLFGTVRKAFEIMESVWRKRATDDMVNFDLATCLRYGGELVILV
ncbi:hypothetical protein PV08_11453 [Exophiala spinifera]|uniref:Zn(2)-C6 fungal-type domain-containing protein n=1 Tax=Exophiala spinifera TaxID=91928 RepID=A0A0D2BGQ1_9EURO|nr:uncharacterized protein PV08_11453 [Exophiala spinifera]KIW10489.1 hypothetical protein PV08_11453 [Exophiala spinifera]